MKRFSLIWVVFLFVHFSHGQITSGFSTTRDTSYSVQSEFKKHSKNYPFIRVRESFPYTYVQVQTDIDFCKTKERDLKLDIYSSANKISEKSIAIIFVFGGGWRSGSKTMHAPLLSELAAKGYVCFAPDYRLSTEALFPAAIYDLKSVVRWVRKNANKYGIDPNKIIIAGHSAGGELASFIGATNGKKEFEGNGCMQKISSKVNAVINLDGTLAFIHPESGEGDDSKKISAATYWFGYSKTERPDLWKQASPLTHVGEHTPPFQFINSGVARMHAGRDDFNKILVHHNIYTEVKTFNTAPHTFLLFDPWFDSTIIYMDRFIRRVFVENLDAKKPIVVAQEGPAHYKTVSAALKAIPANNRKPVTIYIRNGIYREKLEIDSLKDFVTLIGEDQLNTILTYNDHTGKISPTGDTINTRTSWSFKIKASNFTAQDLTFENSAGFNAGQAVAVESDGDKARFFNCRFIGNQDVLFTNNEGSRQYFEKCYIEGTTDFIFGSSTAWFEKCHIHSKKNSHITAASTPKEKKFGYVFNNCLITGDTSLHNVSLGRPWRPYAHVIIMNSYLGPHIKTEGWSNWNNTENYLTTRYAEYNNYGPGANIEKRVKWAKQLSAEERKNIKLVNVLNGWNPF